MKRRQSWVFLPAAILLPVFVLTAAEAPLSTDSLRRWLTYLSSDELEGRATFSEGLGLAAAYIADELKSAGVKPGGDNGSYFQRVTVQGMKTTSRASVTVEVNGQKRTFKDGEGVTFAKNMGGKQSLEFEGVEFLGYGLDLDDTHDDYRGVDVRGKAVVWLGARGPKTYDTQKIRRQLNARSTFAMQEMGAAASFGSANEPNPNAQAQRNQLPGGADSTAVQNLDLPIPPSVTATDEFFEFLFSGAQMSYAALKAKAQGREPLDPLALKGVKLRIDVDADYQVVNTRFTRNVVGILEGSDPGLKDSYVAFGAHYDHTGYNQGILPQGQTDRINNGADDDGSGTTALIGLAHAFAQAPRAKRSLLFVWHAGEESGLWGSRYFADHPVVPMDKIAAQLNIDMIGRNDSNQVYPVGADRISSELHNILIDANASLAKPMTLDFAMNDRRDPERVYYRSDHYSYASKGIPIIFFSSGLHPDYHRPSDTVDKIDFEKLSRVTRLVQEIGQRIANLDHVPQRDRKGPRKGAGSGGKIE